MFEKLQKVLSHLGYGSRREIETWITAGRLNINGKRAELGQRISLADQVTLDGQFVSLEEIHSTQLKTIVYHKTEGEICSRKDNQGRKTVFSHLPKLSQGRWISVGRLDYQTSGLLLMTTDGELANGLMHPASGVEREYAVRIYGEVTPAILTTLQQGVMLDDGMAKFDRINFSENSHGRNQWFTVILTEGRNREVRRLWGSQGLKINRLIRIRYGPIQLPRDLKPGKWTELNREKILQLRKAAKLC